LLEVKFVSFLSFTYIDVRDLGDYPSWDEAFVAGDAGRRMVKPLNSM
jgi:hypothetical protein